MKVSLEVSKQHRVARGRKRTGHRIFSSEVLGKVSRHLSRKAGPLGAGLRGQCALETSLGWVVCALCLHWGNQSGQYKRICPGAKPQTQPGGLSNRLHSGKRLAACGLDLVPRYILFG